MKFFLVISVIILAGFSSFAQSLTGCLVGNFFYTSYLGTVRTTDNSFSGSKKVYNIDGAFNAINYSGSESCGTIAVNKYGNGSPNRDGDLCFVLTSTKYNSYPGGVTHSYPGGNGTLQNFTVSQCLTLPLDDYLPYFLLVIAGVGYFAISKTRIFA